jgi:glucokinase
MLLGVEIGGTKLQAGLCDRRGALRELVGATVRRRAGARGVLAQLEELIPAVARTHRARAVGIGFGGPVDADSGRVVTSHQVSGWDGFALRGWFERRFGLPATIENDANAAAWAEATRGAGRGARSVFYVTVGTGIGGGFVVDGRIYNGRFGAAEIGHTRLWVHGRWRTLESVASGLAIQRGVSTVAEAGRRVGIALANAIALLNPEVVIVGGGVAQAGRAFFGPLRESVRRLVFKPFCRNVRVMPSELGRAVVVVGAALLAAEAGEGRRMGV